MNQTIKLLVFLLAIFQNQGLFTKPQLIDFSYNKYSQYGDDGIIQKIFEVIGTQSKVCVEFGASNGLFLSNTANLFVNFGWKAILVERRDDLYQKMLLNVKDYDCIPLKRLIKPKGPDSIEKILEEQGISDRIDLMSIDIDGNDYYIFEHLHIRPRVVIIEHNPTIPALLDIYPAYGDQCLGCSVSALVRVAKKKCYSLVAITDTNSYFVVDEEFEKFADFETDLQKIRSRVDKYLRYIFTNYRGEYKIVGDGNFDPSYKLHGPQLPTSIFGNFTVINKILS